ncbi:hypothetical protein AUK40_02090 [Candidatus Wirthbacteria bacterium CG2_30_54_11]|uniref:Amine oxidase domain-containing protein n=1 Tax=Candidatus Wirthbacteria bacterium CG2_30_54_11 TaxID=1817892 RepID=A0A1J5ILJ7_9BACT|nr:MAG: hypothetical protein AUK40_02090 [Candidatus Wirthbacteria bacterium CG2_30_54_11]
MGSEQKIVIIGAGPCGLGAAWRLTELGYSSFDLYEQRPYAGGLASSFRDDRGFTWDIGGHVLFSHYQYFDDLMDSLLSEGWVTHEREAWCYLKDRFVPYPFQYNLRHLDREDVYRCVTGLLDLKEAKPKAPENFREWILQSAGQGIADLFLLPYNFKVWAHPLEEMSYSWIGERVPVVDLKRLLGNILLEKDDISWGPNATFRFPRQGGTGEIWRTLAGRIPDSKMHFGQEVLAIEAERKMLSLSDGSQVPYDILISTMPLDLLLCKADLKDESDASRLKHSSTHVVGIGMKGSIPDRFKTKCWMYFSEDTNPFYRVTAFSNYAADNVPGDGGPYWSLMAEVSDSRYKPVWADEIVEEVIRGMVAAHLLEDRSSIVDTWQHFEPYGYPIPSLGRDQALGVLKQLEQKNIYSRGRFGAWKYEVSNQDHTLMQGVEVVDRLLADKPETTVWYPERVNR